jgi:hypothetical protein
MVSPMLFNGLHPQNYSWRWVWLDEVAQALTNARKSAHGKTNSAKN